ncbi:unnamed protein product [Durusdinium trenchii]|uniref:alpha-amylase n=1 Tax=Durusdinium trenchii TaxID=1381693 RepID=A0ABP0JDW2_9DINO
MLVSSFLFEPSSGPLEAMPLCYLPPLVDKPGCQRCGRQEGPLFGLNELKQETSARTRCLESARAAKCNVWVFRVGSCELWNCSSKEALHRAADSGVAEPDGTFLKDYHGRLVTTSRDRTLVAEDTPVASLAVALRPTGSVAKLQSADGHFVTVASSGSLEASRWDDGETFNITREGAYVLLQSPRGLLRSDGTAIMVSRREGRPPEEGLFRVVRGLDLPSGSRKGWTRNDTERVWVHSSLCNYQEPFGGEGGRERRSATYVKLWEWNYVDVLKECQEVLGPSGVTAVQLSPVAEHLVGPQWWVRYQPVSASLHSRSGTADELRSAVAGCRTAGVEVIIDVVLNHMARPCPAAQELLEGTPCVGWNGTAYGNRRTAGARGWDAATPLHFHHRGKEIWGACGVGPETGFLCGSPVTTDCSCCPCDMYGLPDWDLAVKAVEESHARHLEELHRMGVTMLRIDAALYMESDLVSRFLNRFPWDMVYQEWWHELPLPGRTDVFGLYRDLKFMRRIAEFLDVAPLARSPEVLNVTRGDFYINPNEAVYPTCFHDGRSDRADPAVPTFKNGLAFHQQQLFMLASPFPITVLLWGGYAWRQIDDGPPGCEPGGAARCVATSPHQDGCMATPGASPLAEGDVEDRRWVCEHRWQGVAGLIRFRRSCRQPMTESWHSGHGGTLLSPGHVAFRLGGSCFVAIARGAGRWQLSGLATQLPPGRYCDLGSWDGRTCVREVVLGPGGRVLEGGPACPQGNQCGGHAAHTES